MKLTKVLLMMAGVASAVSLISCKNSNTRQEITPADNSVNKTEIQATPQDKNLDVVAFANLYCKTTDLDKAKLFLGKDNDPMFTIRKDVENNYASVSANRGDQNTLEFYMWIDRDGEKILGVNLTESGEKGHNKRSLAFFTYDARLNMVVPCKRLNEVFTNKMMSMRRTFSSFVLRIPTSQENQNITLQYYDKQKKYHELVFVWDGKTFNVE